MDWNVVREMLERRGVVLLGVAGREGSLESCGSSMHDPMGTERVEDSDEEGPVGPCCREYHASTMKERSDIGCDIPLPSLQVGVPQPFTAPQEFVGSCLASRTL